MCKLAKYVRNCMFSGKIYTGDKKFQVWMIEDPNFPVKTQIGQWIKDIKWVHMLKFKLDILIKIPNFYKRNIFHQKLIFHIVEEFLCCREGITHKAAEIFPTKIWGWKYLKYALKAVKKNESNKCYLFMCKSSRNIFSRLFAEDSEAIN